MFESQCWYFTDQVIKQILTATPFLTMNFRDEAAAKAKELKEDGPVIQKWYGDAQLEAAMKYKKGVSWAKRWKKMAENENKSKFLNAVPDGTTFC